MQKKNDINPDTFDGLASFLASMIEKYAAVLDLDRDDQKPSVPPPAPRIDDDS